MSYTAEQNRRSCETQLSANHISVLFVPVLITDPHPGVVEIDLNQALPGRKPLNQPNCRERSSELKNIYNLNNSDNKFSIGDQRLSRSNELDGTENKKRQFYLSLSLKYAISY